MNASQKIYYALGELAYLVAMADGELQNSEIRKLHEIVIKEIKLHNASFEYSDIIFNVLSQEKPNLELIYRLAIEELSSASDFVTPELKTQIISVLTNIAEAYQGINPKQQELIDKVQVKLENMNL